jgi:acylglycerol lipase
MLQETSEQRGCIDRRLHTQRWLPDGAPRAVVVLAHGLAEHSGRYGELARHLTARGLALYGLDHRGHGRSEGPRANIERFAYVVADLATLIAAIRAADPSRPLFLLGHSMGGAVALSYALQNPTLLDGLVLSAPLLATDPKVPPLKRLAGHVLSVVAPSAGLLTLEAAAVSRDPVVVREYENDPLVFHAAIPARTLVELLAALKWLAARAPELRMPVLALHGTADRLVPLEFVAPVYERIGSPDRTVHRYEGLYHELFNEPERARVYADLAAWLDAHLPAH